MIPSPTRTMAALAELNLLEPELQGRRAEFGNQLRRLWKQTTIRINVYTINVDVL